MGKVLIIKGADFSAVSAGVIDIDGKFELSRLTAAQARSGYFATNGNWTADNNYTTCFWSVKKDKYAVIGGTSSYSFELGFVSSVDATSRDLTLLNTAGSGNQALVVKAPQDGYVMSVLDSGATEKVLPSESCILNDASSLLSIAKDSYLYKINGHCKANGTWGIGAETLCYPAIKGETIAITTGGNPTAICCIKESPSNVDKVASSSPASNKTLDLGDGNHRIYIEANSSYTFTVPQNCVVGIYAKEGTTDLWPSSIVVGNI